MTEFKEKYQKEIKKNFMKEFGIKNEFNVPRLSKIVINAGMGEAITHKEALDKMKTDIASICGQMPKITKSTKAISNFKLREGAEIGLTVTLRGSNLWDFFEKLIRIVLHRIKDFRGVSSKSFDGNGNYSIGIREHSVFPEIDPNKMDKLRSLQVTIVIENSDNEKSFALLKMFKMPFAQKNR